jgi:hypothetical protein
VAPRASLDIVELKVNPYPSQIRTIDHPAHILVVMPTRLLFLPRMVVDQNMCNKEFLFADFLGHLAGVVLYRRAL